MSLVLAFYLDPNLNFRTITSLKYLTVWNEHVVIAAIGEKNPWTNITNLGALLLLFFVLDAVFTAWRRGDRRQAAGVGGSLAIAIILSLLQSELMNQGILPLPFSLSSIFLIIILGISYQIADDLLRVNQLSRELKEAHARMVLAAKATDLGIWEWDVVNDSFWTLETGRRRLGARKGESINLQRFLQSVHDDDRESTRRELFSVMYEKKDAEIDLEYRFVKPDEAICWMSTSGIVNYGSTGPPLLVRGVSVDITSRKNAEKVMKESEEMLKAAERIARLGSWKLNIQDNSLTWSDEIFRIFEITPEDFGASYEAFLALVHPDDRELVNKTYIGSLETRQPYSITHRLCMPDGRVKFVHEQCETSYDADGDPLYSLGTVQDITRNVENEDERIQLRQELAHTHRIMQMSELSTTLAHEINQPLGAIMNNASAARNITGRREDEKEELTEILDDIVLDAERTAQVVRNIRSSVEKKQTHFQVVNINDIIEDVGKLFRKSFSEKQITVHMDLMQDLPLAKGDRTGLQQVLINLIANSLEAMRASRIKELRISSVLQAPDIVVAISDSGTGIDALRKGNMFEPFFSTKSGGLGMGLRISRTIIKEHGGRIWFDNNRDAGATFYFSVPVYERETA